MLVGFNTHALRLFHEGIDIVSAQWKQIIWHYSFWKGWNLEKKTYSIPHGSSGHRLKQKKRFFEIILIPIPTRAKYFWLTCQLSTRDFICYLSNEKRLNDVLALKTIKVDPTHFSEWVSWTSDKKLPEKIQGTPTPFSEWMSLTLPKTSLKKFKERIWEKFRATK